jgi:hypothetical protein
MNTLLLDPVTWDLTVTASGNIATAYDSAPVPASQRTLYALAQDVASACRLFLGELWYDTSQGVPYWQQILSRHPAPPASFLQGQLVQAAMTVPGIASATCVFTSFKNRNLAGTVTCQSVAGKVVVTFGASQPAPTAPWYINAAPDWD